MLATIDVSFLQELAKDMYVPISRKEEKRLILTYQRNGDPDILQKLIRHNLRFIVKHVMGGTGVSSMDAIQAAVLGFKKAVQKFDTKKQKTGKGEGYKLITYAKGWIRYEIQEHERKLSVVAPSHYAKYNGVKIMGNICQSPESTDSDMAARTGLTQRRVRTAHKALSCILPIGDDNGSNDTVPDWHFQADSACPHDEAVRNEESELIHGVLRLLPSEEAQVIKRRYLEEGLSYRQLSVAMRCSHETVRKLEKKGLNRMKAILGMA